MIDDLKTVDDYPTDARAQQLSPRLVLSAVTGTRVLTKSLPWRGSVTLGRGSAAAVKIDDPSISRLHAVLHLGPAFTIEDAGSTNGVRVGGRQLAPGERCQIDLCQPLTLGSVTVILFASTAPAAKASSPLEGEGDSAEPVVIHEPAMAALHQRARQLAASNISVLLLGETGCGKEVLAESIHRYSPRAARPFLRLNCAELAESLLESELFGHEKGAFSGATTSKPGLLEAADGGTVFLDELGEMPAGLQAKLLRVIEERKVRRVGGLHLRPIDVRFIAATNRDLAHEAQEGRFRRDLLYRLDGVSLVIPPLRQRRGEIASLATLFIERFAREIGCPAPRLGEAALQVLTLHGWPGNVRELRNVIQRSVIMSHHLGEIRPEHTLLDPSATSPPADPGDVVATVDTPRKATDRAPTADERQRIVDALASCGGNQTQAARLLGVGRTKLVQLLEEYGLPRPKKRQAS